MLQPKVQRFLVAFFNSIVLSTAFLACGFAKASSLLPRSRPLTAANLNARWLLNELTMIRDAARSKVGGIQTKICRPSWATHYKHRNGYHFRSKGRAKSDIFAGEGRAGSAEEKRTCAEKARRFNRQQQLARRTNQLAECEVYKDALSRDGCRTGLFDMGDARTPFAVGELLEAGYLRDTGFVANAAARWERVAGERTKRDPRVPKDKVELEDICGEVCTDDVKVSELPIHKLYHDLVAALETVILHLLEQTPDNDMPILHIVFSDRDGNTSHAWWQCICHWKAHASHKFEAVLISYLVSSVEPGEQPSHPYEIQVRQPTRLGWQGFNADVFRSVALHLAQQIIGCSADIHNVATAKY